MFLPFLAALSALFGGVKKRAGKYPKAIKQAEIQGRKRRQKQVKNGGRRTSRIKEYADERRQTPKNTAAATPCGISKGMSKRKICEIHGIYLYAIYLVKPHG